MSTMDVTITPYHLNDIEELYQVVIASFDHLKPWMPWLHNTYCIDDTAAWVRSCIESQAAATAFRYLIRSNKNDEILGAAGIDRIVWSHKVGELGYWVASSVVNRGVATSAARQVARDAFSKYEIKRIEIHVLTDNSASNKVALKAGAVFEGTFRNKLFHNGLSHPANGYSLIPSDLPL